MKGSGTSCSPQLQIISEDLWAAAHTRIQQTRNVFARATSGTLLGRPARLDLESPYLLSGMGYCALCGGSLMAVRCGKGVRLRHYYLCAYHFKRGNTVCTNALRIPQAVLDDAFLQAITSALDNRILETAVEKTLQHFRTRLIDVRQKHLTDAIARGDQMDCLLAALKTEKTRKSQLVAELHSMTALINTSPREAGRIVRALKPQLADIKGWLMRRCRRPGKCYANCRSTALKWSRFWRTGSRGIASLARAIMGDYWRVRACN